MSVLGKPKYTIPEVLGKEMGPMNESRIAPITNPGSSTLQNSSGIATLIVCKMEGKICLKLLNM